jgi:Secretion system C-terminal sorting domain
MRYKILAQVFVLALLLCQLSSNAQELQLSLQKCHGNQFGIAAIEADDNGGYFITSSTWPYVIGTKIWYVSRYDKNSNLLWTRNYGGSTSSDGFTKIARISSNRYLFAGSSASVDSDLVNCGSPSGSVWLAILDTNGNIIQCRTWAIDLQTSILTVRVSPNGKIYVLGGTFCTTGDFSGNTKPGYMSPFLIHTDTALTKKWVKVFNAQTYNVNDDFYACRQMALIGDSVVLGIQSWATDTGGMFKPPADTGDFNNSFVFAFDTAGNYQTLGVYGGEALDYVSHLTELPNGNIFSSTFANSRSGSFAVPASNMPSCHCLPPPQSVEARTVVGTMDFANNAMHWKKADGEIGCPLTINGNVQTVKVLVSDTLIYHITVVRGSDNCYMGLGFSNLLELYVTVYGQSGSFITRKRFSSGGDFGLQDATVSSDGLIYLAGEMRKEPSVGVWPDSVFCTKNKFPRFAVVYKLQMWPTATNPLFVEKFLWQLVPNPAAYSVQIKLDKVPVRSINLRIRDMAGQLVLQNKFMAQEYNCSLGSLSSGTYLVELEIDGQRSVQKLRVQ